ncbi:MAG: chemotaxis-specific protein-glutamate methyltransferase CheB [Oligoflexus sp.]
MQQFPSINDDDFRYFQKIILEASGISLSSTKKELLQTRLLSRLKQLKMASFHEYRKFLESIPPKHGEWQHLTNQISTNKTDFFREAAHFKFLMENFLPEWQKNHPQQKLRVWSAAASTGEEAYTLAMILDEYFAGKDAFEIYASDVNTKVLRYAENAVYPRQRLMQIPETYHRSCLAFGSKGLEDWFRIAKRLQNRVQFAQRNLLHGPFHDLGMFDIIFCRNVFIYFPMDVVEKIIHDFYEVSSDHGLLVIGHSENLIQTKHKWRQIRSSILSKSSTPQAQKAPISLVHTDRPSARQKTKVLVVDDSPTIRRLLASIIDAAPDLELVASVGNPLQVADAIQSYHPDVMTLDINMPEMNGCQLLERILPQYPIPAVIVSSLGIDQGDKVLRALEIGAVDYLQKPSLSDLKTLAPILIETLLTASQVKINPNKKLPLVKVRHSQTRTTTEHCHVIAIGASTGGTKALGEILSRLPDDLPPIVIVQHIPPVFSKAFADRLNRSCPLTIKEAEDGEILQDGHVYIAPGSHHMHVMKSGSHYQVALSEEAPVNLHRPSVDVLFESVAKVLGPKSLGILLTGMGADGAKGLLQMKESGACTIAQDEQSCVVFGMPKEAWRLGAAEQMVNLDQIPEFILRYIDEAKQKQVPGAAVGN